MDIWVRDLDLERPRALEEEKDQPIGSPMPRYEGARGLWQVGPPRLRQTWSCCSLFWRLGDFVLTKFLKELADGAGGPGLGSGALLGAAGACSSDPHFEFYLFKQ